MQKIQFPSLGQEKTLEEGLAPHSNIPAGMIKWTEEPGPWGSKEPDNWAQAQAYPVGRTPGLTVRFGLPLAHHTCPGCSSLDLLEP